MCEANILISRNYGTAGMLGGDGHSVFVRIRVNELRNEIESYRKSSMYGSVERVGPKWRVFGNDCVLSSRR